MICCRLHLNFLPQLYRCGNQTAIQLVQDLRRLIEGFGGNVEAKDAPLKFTFDVDGPFGRLQISETITRLSALIREKQGRLRGGCLLVHMEDDEEHELRWFRQRQTARNSEFAAYCSGGARRVLADYFEYVPAGPGFGQLAPKFGFFGTVRSLEALLYRPATVKALAGFIEQRRNRTTRLLHVRTDSGAYSAKALALLPGMRKGRIPVDGVDTICLYADKASENPLFPFIRAFDQTRLDRLRAACMPEERTRLDILLPAFVYLKQVNAGAGIPETLLATAVSFIHLVLDCLSASTADQQQWLLCHQPEEFPPLARDIIAERIRHNRGAERYLAYSHRQPPDEWQQLGDKNISLVSCLDENLDTARSQILQSWPEALQPLIRDRLAELGPEGGTMAAGSRLLDWLPPEVTLYLHCRELSGADLDRDQFEAFLSGAGLRRPGLEHIERLLTITGYMDPELPGRLVGPLPVMAAARLPYATEMRREFSGFLVRQYQEGRRIPSLALLRQAGEPEGEARFAFDCIMSSALQPGTTEEEDSAFLSSASRLLYNFYAGGARRDQKRQATALKQISLGPPDAFHVGLQALMQAEFAYAEGSITTLASKAREALLHTRPPAPPRLIARTQRIMGLAALTMEKYTDAADYFTNAAEIAENAGEKYEFSNALYIRAITEYMHGSLVKAARSVEAALELSNILCRPDLAVQQGMLAARITMDLGQYSRAAVQFGELSGVADDQKLAAAARRADIWQARCLSYDGKREAARLQLREHAEDIEARVFLAEMEIMHGNPETALGILQQAGEQPPRRFLPPDSFNANSLIQEIEGRCIAADQDWALLEDMSQVLYLFADGLVSRLSSRAAELAALSRTPRLAHNTPSLAMYCMYCYLLECELGQEAVDKQTILSRAFNSMQQRAGRIEDRASRTQYMENNLWNRRLVEAAREHKFL